VAPGAGAAVELSADARRLFVSPLARGANRLGRLGGFTPKPPEYLEKSKLDRNAGFGTTLPATKAALPHMYARASGGRSGKVWSSGKSIGLAHRSTGTSDRVKAIRNGRGFRLTVI
jgi:hypothetical protein